MDLKMKPCFPHIGSMTAQKSILSSLTVKPMKSKGETFYDLYSFLPKDTVNPKFYGKLKKSSPFLTKIK